MQITKRTSSFYAILHLAHPDYSAIAWRWLLGENLTSDERKVIRVEENISDVSIAEVIFQDVIDLLISSGHKSIVLLIDEFENFTLIPKNQRDRFMDGMRHFIDNNPKSLYLIFTTTPFAWTELTEVTTALTRRLAGNEYELKFFNEKDIKELIIRYLKLVRKDQELPKIANEYETDELIFPFTEDSIKKLYELSEGLVSSVIKYCRKSIDYSIESKIPIIDSKVIEKINI